MRISLKLGSNEDGAGESYGTYLKGVFQDYLRNTECKRLLTKIASLQENQGFKALAVISDAPREGKSFLTIVLALGYATLLNKNVLIVDAVAQTKNRTMFIDKLISVTQAAEIKAANGATTTTNNGAPPTSFTGLVDLLTTKGESGESFDNSDFQIGPYVKSLGDNYDLVLFDTCALSDKDGDKLDPVVISKCADAAILVTSSRSLDRHALAKLGQRLDSWGLKLLGTVFNNRLGR